MSCHKDAWSKREIVFKNEKFVRSYPTPVLGLLLQKLANYELNLTDRIGDFIPLVRMYRRKNPFPLEFRLFKIRLNRLSQQSIHRQDVLNFVRRCWLFCAYYESRTMREPEFISKFEKHHDTLMRLDLSRVSWDLDHLRTHPDAHFEPCFPDARLPTKYETDMYFRLICY